MENMTILEGDKKAKMLLISPHRDDELIGCYTLLKYGEDIEVDILYLFKDASEDKGIKAEDFPSIRKIYDPIFIEPSNIGGWSDIFDYIQKEVLNDYTFVLVPHISDNHISHKLVNIAVKQVLPLKKIMYYQVEMNLARPLSYDESKEKLLALEKYYGARYVYLKSEKYRLFETLESSDHKRYINMTFFIEGEHHWPTAKGKYSKELSSPHKHLFKFEVILEVFGNDRELEFLEVRDELKEFAVGLAPFNEYQTKSFMSCEDIAQEVMQYIFRRYPKREVKVSVYEDNGCGSTLHWKGI